MPITNPVTGTRIDEIEDGIYRISTPVPPSPELPPGFSFNQFLVVDDAPLLFHTGQRRLFPAVREAVATVIAPESLRFIAFSHVEGDECGSLREWLETAPQASPVCSRVGAMIYSDDATDRPTRALPCCAGRPRGSSSGSTPRPSTCALARRASRWRRRAARRATGTASRTASPGRRPWASRRSSSTGRRSSSS